MNPVKNSRNCSGILKIVVEDDEFSQNHITAGRGFVEKFDGLVLASGSGFGFRDDSAKWCVWFSRL